jgi:hypothetical protein
VEFVLDDQVRWPQRAVIQYLRRGHSRQQRHSPSRREVAGACGRRCWFHLDR